MDDRIEAYSQTICHSTLPDGTPVIVRPIRRDGRNKLAEGLQQLSPQTRYQRFFVHKKSFTPAELDFLTHCDGKNHLALVLAVTDTDGNELKSVAVARCVRDDSDPSLAEFAIVVIDEWQQRGVGRILINTLARQAWEVGIRRWRANHLHDNTGIRKLMKTVGTKQLERSQSPGIIEVIYDLSPPPDS
jgi:GNAT superfamily N-acetyltransferase